MCILRAEVQHAASVCDDFHRGNIVQHFVLAGLVTNGYITSYADGASGCSMMFGFGAVMSSGSTRRYIS